MILPAIFRRKKNGCVMTSTDDLRKISDEANALLQEIQEGGIAAIACDLQKAGDQAKKAWSGSNLGYHSTVYYAGLQPVPAHIQFSPEWGLEDRWPVHQPDDRWQEMDFETVYNEILRRAGNPDIDRFTKALVRIRNQFSDLKERALSALIHAQSSSRDAFIQRKIDQIEKLAVSDPKTIEASLILHGAGWSRDSTAITQGYRVAPHQSVTALALSEIVTENGLEALEAAARSGVQHLIRGGSQEGDEQVNFVPPKEVPASDRVVTLDHNSERYQTTLKELDALTREIEVKNDYEDVADKEERIAELSAGRRLLQSTRVRAAAVGAVLGPALMWLAQKFAGNLVGDLANSLWALIRSLIGL